MKHSRPILAFLLALLIVLGVTFSQKPLSATAQEGSTNQIYVDITFDPKAKTYSIGGFSEAQLKQFGAPALQDEIWDFLGALQGANLKVDSAKIDLTVDQANLATLNWNQKSRALIYTLVDTYSGMPLIDQARAEDWLSKANIEFALRKSPEISKPLLLNLATAFNVDITKEGIVNVEGFNTGTSLTPEVIQILEMGKISNAAVCWDKGALDATINGAKLPQLVIYSDGLSVLDRAFGLNIGDVQQLFQSKLGASILYGDGDHGATQCGQ